MSGGARVVLSRTALSTFGMAVQGLARFAYTVIIGNLAGSGALGDTSALLSVAVYLSLVAPAGLGVAASRYLPVPELAGAAVGWLNRWFWITSTVLAAAAIPIALWMTGDVAASLSAAVLVWAYNAYVFTRGALMGEDRVLRAALADLCSSLLAITALVAVLLAGAHWALLLPLALGYAAFALVSRPRTRPAPVDDRTRREFSRFVRDAVIGAMATGGLLPITMVFVRAFDTQHQADLFAAALSLATPASMVSQAANQVLIPYFARQQGDPAALVAAHRRMLAVTVTGFAVVFGAIALLAPQILALFYPRLVDGAPMMQALLGIVFLISATSAPSAYLVAVGRQRIFATIWAVAFVLGAVTMLIASPALGAWGALAGFALGGGGGSIAVIAAALILQPREERPAEPASRVA